MPIEETENTFRVRQENPDKYEKFRVKEITEGVKFVFGKVKGKDEWEVQSVIFDKEKFKTKEEVRKWCKEHDLKAKKEDILYLKQIEDFERYKTIGYRPW